MRVEGASMEKVGSKNILLSIDKTLLGEYSPGYMWYAENYVARWLSHFLLSYKPHNSHKFLTISYLISSSLFPERRTCLPRPHSTFGVTYMPFVPAVPMWFQRFLRRPPPPRLFSPPRRYLAILAAPNSAAKTAALSKDFCCERNLLQISDDPRSAQEEPGVLIGKARATYPGKNQSTMPR